MIRNRAGVAKKKHQTPSPSRAG